MPEKHVALPRIRFADPGAADFVHGAVRFDEHGAQPGPLARGVINAAFDLHQLPGHFPRQSRREGGSVAFRQVRAWHIQAPAISYPRYEN